MDERAQLGLFEQSRIDDGGLGKCRNLKNTSKIKLTGLGA